MNINITELAAFIEIKLAEWSPGMFDTPKALAIARRMLAADDLLAAAEAAKDTLIETCSCFDGYYCGGINGIDEQVEKALNVLQAAIAKAV